MQYGAAVPEEDADAAPLAGPGEVGLAPIGQLLRGSEVVFDGRDALVKSHVEIVVEVASLRRIPREGPAHPPPKWLDLADRRPGYRRERCLAGGQVGQATQAIGRVRTDRTAHAAARARLRRLH